MSANELECADIFGGRVSVVLGGIGGEREVSLRTGAAIVASLERQGVACAAVRWPGSDFDAMLRAEPHTVFVALHGRYGEDGVLQGALELTGHACTGSGVHASAVCMDKVTSKLVAQSVGVRTPEWEVRREGSTTPPRLHPPLVVKPARDGSSVGLAFVDDLDAWEDALRGAWRGQGVALVERRVRGREMTVAILDDEVLGSLEIRPQSGVYDYEAKYVRQDTRYLCPPELATAARLRMESDALLLYRELGCSGLARIDFLVDEHDEPWFLEVNTVPGMTESSLAPRIAEAAGLSFDALVARMVRGARVPAWREGNDA